MPLSNAQLAQTIDHTLLAPDASDAQIRELCRQAAEHRFYSVCVNSANVPLAARELADTGVLVCAVVGFPLGAGLSATKAFEATAAIAAGAGEIDMVINIGALKSGRADDVKADIDAVHRACGTVPLKVILETGLLTDGEKVRVCEMCRDLGVAFVKTSTGFGHGGATLADVALDAPHGRTDARREGVGRRARPRGRARDARSGRDAARYELRGGDRQRSGGRRIGILTRERPAFARVHHASRLAVETPRAGSGRPRSDVGRTPGDDRCGTRHRRPARRCCDRWCTHRLHHRYGGAGRVLRSPGTWRHRDVHVAPPAPFTTR